jgi:hypothetical protein
MKHNNIAEGENILLGPIAHVGPRIRDRENALTFYRDLLGLVMVIDVTIVGEEADRLTRAEGAVLRAVSRRSVKGFKAL